jgi:carboxyl-terminal processing protease
MITRINWRVLFCIVFAISFSPISAQLRINGGDGSPMRKLQLAEVMINNLYVDSVDEKKLVEDAIRGML